jgi:hypothetical protein
MFKIGDTVIIRPAAYTRAGEVGTIIIICGENAVVQFDDGEELGFLLDDEELELGS